MANDVSYFKVAGDNTKYSFNDADVEAAEQANSTAIETLNNNLLAYVTDLDALLSRTTTEHTTARFAANTTGAPSSVWGGYVETIITSTTYGSQWAYLGNGNIYTRAKNNGTIGDWVLVHRNQSVTVSDVNVNSKNIQARVIGNVCYVSGWVTPKAQSYSAGSTALVRMSVVPAARTFFVGVNGSTGACYGMELTAAGNIVFNSSSPTFSGNPYIYMNFTYITAT